MINEKVKCSFTTIPFQSFLSFEYLLDEIAGIARHERHPMADSAKHILEEIENVPELKNKITDYKIVKQNRDLVNRMMTFVFNPLEDNVVISSAGAPFHPKSFYSTKQFDDTFRGESRKLKIAEDYKYDVLHAVIYQAFLIILVKFYHLNFDIDISFTYKLTNEETNSVNYYKMLVNPKYTGIKVHGSLNTLSAQDIKDLLDNSSDLDFWNEKIPLEKFEFLGFLHFTYINITHEYVVSQLKSDLLDKDTIISQDGFHRIREKLRALMNIPDLEFGIAVFSDYESIMNHKMIWKSILSQSELSRKEYLGTLYEKAYLEKSVIITDDLRKLKKDKMVSAFLNRELHNHAIIPLLLDNEIVAMMEFAAKNPDQINMVKIKRLRELFPVFTVVFKRSREELLDRIRAIIQEKYTAIHPAVEWRFREAALQNLYANLEGERSRMEPIYFPDVVPVYGAADIRNSSVERNRAIRADLMEQLTQIRKILLKAISGKDMPLLDHLIYLVDEYMKTVNVDLKAGDEVGILEFLKKDIEPVFTQLQQRDKSIEKNIAHYFKKIDPDLKILYKKRKDFEDSISQINETIAKVLDEEQARAQRVFPHYFEKYRTDGIEYNAYIGQALVKDKTFDPIYLKNIRLWQLLVEVKIARKVRELLPSLKIKLDVTHLILVHSNPISITFRQDEKKFDVAGAYNIRYEITKKRIDKAVIKGTNERITQVGRIAIIYSHVEEIEEYKKYIHYMIDKKYLKETIEDFELEDLKGASGLRALRVEVDFSLSSELQNLSIAELREAMANN